ncbi:uncharacterized protein LOC106645349 [Copidosoma floridanum]|uniref:uncharacterized protein LOC106645349 n=1 Tax=Copidosoma floridanum TaxID=29053 RepID=UPI0006C9D841|nr:uncharacterized protein LOC106645349 [Copidosoma floridanum]
MAFVDGNDIVRVGGRLTHSALNTAAILLAILPRHSQLTSLVVKHAHQVTLHGGTQLTLSRTHHEFWIIGGRASIRSSILKCVTCARYRAQCAQQMMGQLPEARVTPSRPFSHTGVDYAGPLTIKSWKGRGSRMYKGWICVFVSFSSSEVHLEAVTDCSTDGFLAAYRRFTLRRGLPLKLYSECGTNFVGADKALRQHYTDAQPSPHMGGKWEAAVKSIKFHLRRTVGEALYTYEEISTLLTQIESVLNYRPLEPISNDSEISNVSRLVIFSSGRHSIYLQNLAYSTYLSLDSPGGSSSRHSSRGFGNSGHLIIFSGGNQSPSGIIHLMRFKLAHWC